VNGFGDIELTGPRLTLRPWRPEDAPAVHAAMQDRSMHRFLALPDPYTESDAQQFVTELGHEGRYDGVGLGCAVVERSSGRLVGSAALRMGPPAGDGEIGYWIAAPARGAGYAAEAVGVLADFGFDAGLARIRIVSDVGNLASISTALRAGFSYEGIARAALLSGDAAPGGQRRGPAARFAALPSDARTPIGSAFVRLAEPFPDDGVIRIRPTEPGDAERMFEAEDDVARGWGFTAEEPTRAAFDERAARAGLEWLVGGTARMTIVDLALGEPAGFLDLRRSGPPGVGGIGYTVHPAFRGRGYTARALHLVSRWAFDHAHFARLELGAKIGNIASQRAALAGGFEPDGVRRVRLRNPDGTYSDEARFALVNPAFASPSRISP